MSRKKTEKTESKITLVIPARGDEVLLQKTIDHAITVAGCEVDVIVVDNGITVPQPVGRNVKVVQPEIAGTSAARHFGMMLAKTDVVVTIDAHVRLDRCWALNILQTFEDSQWHQTVACGHVGHLSAAFLPEDEPCYHGARINWMDTSAEPRALVARWDAHTKPGSKIGAIMGAYYAMRADWYQAMCCPWQVNRSWGCDEELISIASYLSGGDCRILPEDCRAWHRFNTSTQIQYEHREIVEIINNRLRMLLLFPFESREIAACCQSMALPMPPPLDTDTLTTFADCYSVNRPVLKNYLEKWVTGYNAWNDRIELAVQELAKARLAVLTSTDPKPFRLAPMPVDICPQCDAQDSFLVTNTYPTFRRYKCERCGKKAWRLKSESTLNFGIRND
jgi:glycosyltransferase involved in cell wall biosynthesis